MAVLVTSLVMVMWFTFSCRGHQSGGWSGRGQVRLAVVTYETRRSACGRGFCGAEGVSDQSLRSDTLGERCELDRQRISFTDTVLPLTDQCRLGGAVAF